MEENGIGGKGGKNCKRAGRGEEVQAEGQCRRDGGKVGGRADFKRPTWMGSLNFTVLGLEST